MNPSLVFGRPISAAALFRLRAVARANAVAAEVSVIDRATLDLRAERAVLPDWTLGVAVNKVVNRVYETAYGYPQPLRQGLLTLRDTPR